MELIDYIRLQLAQIEELYNIPEYRKEYEREYFTLKDIIWWYEENIENNDRTELYNNIQSYLNKHYRGE